MALKKKGFDEKCLAHAYTNREDDFHLNSSSKNNTEYDLLVMGIAMPLYQQVVDWFRDEHSIYIAVLPFREKGDGVELCWYYSIVQDDEDLPDILCNEDDLGAHGDNYPTPKEAWDEAFLEALKLI